MSTASLPSLLLEMLELRRVFNLAGAEVPLNSNVSREEATQLHVAVRELRPSVSVEVGFAQGTSTLAILDALRISGGGHHHVIDPFQANYDYCGVAMVRKSGLEALHTFHEKFADEVIPTLPALQFAFIDSSHLFDLTMSEFVLVDRRLETGGVVGFHDMWMASQQAFVRYILANRAYTLWHPAGWSGSAKHEHGWKQAVRSALQRLPRAERIFAQDFLYPWPSFGIGNLVFLRKIGEDARDWTFHRPF